jgi:hypothetical protein
MPPTTHNISPSRFVYTLAIAVVAAIAVAGSVWVNGKAHSGSADPASAGIDVTALLSDADIAKLPVQNVEQPF